MALPTYSISSSVINVDCLNTSKVLLLPPASTIQGVSLWIRDCAGVASSESTIYVSTQGLDVMDRFASTLALSTPYQSFRVMAWKPTEYAILQNYVSGLSPFLVQFTQGLAWYTRDSVRTWSCVASSSSGQTLLAGVGGVGGGQLYVSYDGGNSWTAVGPSLIWTGVAMSSDGTKMVAVSNGDRIYTSTNSGASWTPRASIKAWTCVCSSQNGDILLAGTTGDTLYLSTDSGVSWTSVNGTTNYRSVACSSTGGTLYAVATADQIYVSTNTGSSWTARDSARNWTGVACSSNGTTAFATEGTYIYKSTNTGVAWTANTSYSGGWRAIACSSDATLVVAVNNTTGFINFSETSGNLFTNSGDSGAYQSIVMNAAGSLNLAAENPGYLYLGTIQLL
jgi:hypothetical protein